MTAHCLKMVIKEQLTHLAGTASRAVLGDGHTSGCANQVPIVAHGGLDVCDGWPGRL